MINIIAARKMPEHIDAQNDYKVTTELYLFPKEREIKP
jgi:hypothetical protein